MTLFLYWLMLAAISVPSGPGPAPTRPAANPFAPQPIAITITGTVVDEKGAKAAGITVKFCPGENTNAPPAAETHSASDGRYLLQLTYTPPQASIGRNGWPWGWIEARDPRRGLVAAVVYGPPAGNAAPVDLALKPGLKLTGSFKDAAGKGMPFLPLSLKAGSNGRAPAFRPVSPMTDAQGAFEIDALPQGLAYTLESTGAGLGTSGIFLSATETARSEIDLPPIIVKRIDTTIRGHVIAPDGSPAARAEVTLLGDGQPGFDPEDSNNGEATKTDNQGAFTFVNVCDGAVTIRARTRRTASGLGRETTVWANGGDQNVVVRVAMNDSTCNDNVKIVTTTGRVLDPTGAPVAGVQLHSTLWAHSIVSDAQGCFTVNWADRPDFGEGELPLIAQDFTRHLAGIAFVHPEDATHDIHLMPALTLLITVKDQSGKPIEDAEAKQLMTQRKDGDTSWNLPMYDASKGSFDVGPDGALVTSDAAGVIRLADLAQGGGYSLDISAPDYGGTSVEVTTAQTGTSELDIPVTLRSATVAVAGHLLDADAEPAPNISVRLEGDGQKQQDVKTDADGRFEFDSVCPGLVNLSADIDRTPGLVATAVAQAHGGDMDVKMRVPINGIPDVDSVYAAVSGRVLDPSGAPVAGAVISCPPDGRFGNSEIKSDAQGRYSLIWIKKANASGTSQLWVHAQDFAHHFATTQLLQESAPTTDLKLQPATILAVKVTDEAGKPIPGTTVAWLHTRAPAQGSKRGRLYLLYMNDAYGYVGPAQTEARIHLDDDGTLHIGDLPQNAAYLFDVTAPGYGVAILSVDPAQATGGPVQLPPITLKKAALTLSGKIVDASGKPLPKIGLELRDWHQPGNGQPMAKATSDDTGAFTFTGVCAGPAEIHITSKGQDVFNTDLTEAKGGQTNVVVKVPDN